MQRMRRDKETFSAHKTLKPPNQLGPWVLLVSLESSPGKVVSPNEQRLIEIEL